MSGSQNGQEPCEVKSETKVYAINTILKRIRDSEVKSETKVYAINTILKICQGSLNLCERGWGLWNMFYKKKS